MRNFDEYKIKSTIADTKDHCVISLSAYAGDSDVAKILCFYMKGGRTLIIGDIDTVPSYKRKGLGLLRIQEVLKILGERNFQVNRCLAADVEGYPPTDGARQIAESFFESLGFERGKKYHWCIDGETLQKKLKEKMQK
jgi:GNAT superfamily N-acetyltransferase